jgi:hypothetical protein
MLLNAITGLFALLFAGTPFLWPHTAAQTAVALLASAVAAVFSIASIADRRYRAVVAAAGGLLALSAFAFLDDILIVAMQVSAGYFFFAAGIAPEIRRIAPAAAVQAEVPEHRQAA